jgi:formylglycine-generating enzyme required for sulfatase activity
MARDLDVPLVDLLARLRDDRLIRLTPEDALRVERLLAARADWTTPLLAQSLAALLAIDAEGWIAIERRVSELLTPPAPVAGNSDSGVAQAATDAAHPARPGPATGRPTTRRLPPERDPVRAALRLHARRPRPRLATARRVLAVLPRVLAAGVTRVRGPQWAAVFAAAPLAIALLLAFRSPTPTPAPVPPSVPKRALEPPPPTPDKPRAELRQITEDRPLPAGPDLDATLRLTPLGWFVLLDSVLLAAWGAAWLLAPRRARRKLMAEPVLARAAREQLATTDTSSGVPYHVERHPPFAETAMDDAAGVLGRIGLASEGTDLDVPATVRRTARAAGRVEPVLRPRFRPAPLLVLVDVESGDHAFLDGVDWVLARWRKLGVPFERHDYAWRPHHLTPAGGGPALTLDQLARRRPDARVLVFSPLGRPERFAGGAPWLRTLAAWPHRVLIDLDPRTDSERSYDVRRFFKLCARAGLPRHPFTPRGLVTAARCLAGERVAVPPRLALRPAHAPEVAEALARWAACASYVPRPGWRQLESLRRAMPELATALPSPAYVVRLVAWISAQREVREPMTASGPGLLMPEALEDRLIAEQRSADAATCLPPDAWLETRARRLLLEQLEAAVPASEYEALRRELKRAVHQAVIDPARAGTLLARFRGSALEPELRELLARERTLQVQGMAVHDWPAAVVESVDAWVARESRVPLGRLVWPVRSVRALTAVLAAVALVGAAWTGVAATVERPATARHYLPGTLRVELPPDPVVVLRPALRPALVRILGGRFRMGSPETERLRFRDELKQLGIDPDIYEDEEPQHDVRVTGFEMCETEVTQGQWQAVIGTNPSDCNLGCDPELPVQNVSWLEAVLYLNALTRQENQERHADESLSPCYEITDEGTLSKQLADASGPDRPELGNAHVEWKPGCTGYRLPTEAEWEYAARAGTQTAFSFDDEALLGEHGWYADNTGTEVKPVKTRKANPWELHDMHGNVYEWVWDWYGQYGRATQRDPRGPTKGVARVVRGGSVGYGPGYLRSAARSRLLPGARFRLLGLRCVRGGPRASTP